MSKQNNLQQEEKNPQLATRNDGVLSFSSFFTAGCAMCKSPSADFLSA
jgi:hypothetical protein